MKGKRIVVTGGAGFIGSHLVHSFGDGNEVIVVDDLSSGKMENIKELVDSRDVRFVRGSITDQRLMKRVCRGVDYVFHHAAIASVPKSVEDPLSTDDVGINGTLVTLLAARDGGVKKVVFASSAGVYGDKAKPPISEDSPLDPLSPYALTKIVGEHYCRLFNELYGLKTVSLRYFNVFGPRQDPEAEYAAVIPRFLSRALAGKNLTVFGDGKQTRDFVFIDDVVRANVLATESKVVGEVNIASGKKTTIHDLAEIVLELTGKDVEIVHERSRKGDIRHSVAAINKASECLGFEPEIDIRHGLRLTIEDFRTGQSMER